MTDLTVLGPLDAGNGTGNSVMNDQSSTWGPSQPLPPNKPIQDNSVDHDDSQACSGEDLVEYNRLLSLTKDLPCELFVDRLLLDYSQCDIKLEQTRQMLYDTLRESDDFPFDKEIDLKRRVNSRHGDPAAVKLAYDIHVLLSVAEGADYTSLKDLISVPKRSSRPSSVGRLSQKSGGQAGDRCACRAEIQQLKDTLSTVQADLLLVKQRHAASENIHNADMTSLKSDVDKVETKQTSLQTELASCVTDVSTCVEKLNSSLSVKISEYDKKHLTYSNDFKALKESVHSLNASILRLQVVLTHAETRDVTPPPSDTGSNNATNDPPPDDPSSSELLQPASGAADMAADTTPLVPTSHNETPPLYSAVLSAPVPCIAEAHEGDSHFGNMKIPTIVTNREGKAGNNRNKAQAGSNRDLNFGVIRREIEEAAKAREDDDADFETHVKRKTKSFYVGGCKSTITEAKVANYIYRRNVNVTNVKIFRGRKYGNVVIRVNVEADDNASQLTDDFSFWPRGVICRPWIPYHQRVRKRNHDTHYTDSGPYRNSRNRRIGPSYGHIRSTNRFETLESDVDID